MAVPVLSTSTTALTAGAAPPTGPSQPTGTTELFAAMIAQLKSGVSSGGKSRPADQTVAAESDGIDADGVAAEAIPDGAPEKDAGSAPVGEPSDILAEMEAMAAAASQLVVGSQIPLPPPISPERVPLPDSEDGAVPSARPTITAAAIFPAVTSAPPLRTAPSLAPGALETVAALDMEPRVASETAPAAVPTDASQPSPQSLPSDIASLLASLKAAFGAADRPTGERAAPAATDMVRPSFSPSTAPVPPEVDIVAGPGVPAAIDDAMPPPAQATGTAPPAPASPIVALPAAGGPAAAPPIVTPIAIPIVQDAPARAMASPDQPSTPSPETPAAETLSAQRPPVADAMPATLGSATAPPATKKSADTPAPAPTAVRSDARPADARPAAAETTEKEADAVAPSAFPPVAATAPAVGAPPIQATEPGDMSASVAGAGQTQQLIDRHLDLARESQWLDRLAQDISQAANREGHLRFQLNPENLGALTVEIANSADGTTIRLTAETDEARTIIADAQPRLLAEVRAQGLRVAEARVDLSHQNDSGGSASPQGQAGQQRQSSADHQPFARTQAAIRDDAADSASRDDGDLYA